MIKKILVVVTYLAMVFVNFLANSLPINNVGTGQVSDSYPNLFAPAGITFSIWGIIYLLLFLYILYQFGIFQKNKKIYKDKLFSKINLYFIISSLANFLWIFAWHYDYILLSVLLIITVLFSLIKIADILRLEKFFGKEKFFIVWPFSIYFGWISVAVIANITVLLVSWSWNGFLLSDQFWTVLIVLVGALIGIWRMLRDKNIPYGLVFIWAYLGILLKHLSKSGFAGQYRAVIVAVIICLISFIISQFILLKKKKL